MSHRRAINRVCVVFQNTFHTLIRRPQTSPSFEAHTGHQTQSKAVSLRHGFGCKLFTGQQQTCNSLTTSNRNRHLGIRKNCLIDFVKKRSISRGRTLRHATLSVHSLLPCIDSPLTSCCSLIRCCRKCSSWGVGFYRWSHLHYCIQEAS